MVFLAAEYGKKIIRTTKMASKSTQELWSPPNQATCLLKIAQASFFLSLAILQKEIIWELLIALSSSCGEECYVTTLKTAV